jgi:hypothetical protein
MTINRSEDGAPEGADPGSAAHRQRQMEGKRWPLWVVLPLVTFILLASAATWVILAAGAAVTIAVAWVAWGVTQACAWVLTKAGWTKRRG